MKSKSVSIQWKLLLIVLFIVTASGNVYARQSMSLAGRWQLFLDGKNAYPMSAVARIPYSDVIHLPGSLDEAGKGKTVEKSNKTFSLSRRYEFTGHAWYQRTVNIPKSWKGKRIFLYLERTRVTHLFVDRHYVDSCLLVSSPQNYDVTRFLTPGNHQVSICVDNGSSCGLPDVIWGSHMFTDNTQTNWNGILGRISLEARPEVFIRKVKVTPDAETKSCRIDIEMDNAGKAVSGLIGVNASGGAEMMHKQTIGTGQSHISMVYKLRADAKRWSEFHPDVLALRVRWLGKDKKVADTVKVEWGLRTMRASGQSLVLNGKKVFLRGKHDGCVFPLTGYAPMDDASWMHYFRVLKSYGFNHVRFHSWCPPEAAFRAADRLGFYLQPELPIWGSVDEDSTTARSIFLRREARAIFDAYGNHPSFVFFSSGNELGGTERALSATVESFRHYDSRFLFAAGSNYHLGWIGPLPAEDIFVSCRKGSDGTPYGGNLRSSFSFVDADRGGMLNALPPNTEMNFEKAARAVGKPVIGHETGQFQVYPNPAELSKYTGVLRPDNLETFLHRAYSRHGEGRVNDFLKASGALSLLCYKGDIEATLRTPSMSGFQMLDLQDYPGQGTALVGLLDAFMGSKGLVTPDSFRSFCQPVVPLWQSPRFAWTADAAIYGKVLLSNYGETALPAIVDWSLLDARGHVIRKGTLQASCPQGSLTTMGTVHITSEGIPTPLALTLQLDVRGTTYRNAYHLWLYPTPAQAPQWPKNVRLFKTCDETLTAYLEQGGTACLMPDSATYPGQTVGGLFTSDYWNFSMFKSISENAHKPVSPGTFGYFIDASHPALRLFPTTTHTDWQWWSVAQVSSPLIMDGLHRKSHFIVEAIDNVERCHQLGVMMEYRVGQGRLFICMCPLTSQLNDTVCRQLYVSLCEYLDSKDFAPVETLTAQELLNLFRTTSSDKDIKGQKNISDYK